ncbi:flagellar hook-length control protein FliK [Sulfuricurvum sp.]|uniref:flagellar hook-length control protein FliK n=1 Tax=Sulfuricurvum sp. TaxID=2025608 RepID=UPI003563B262
MINVTTDTRLSIVLPNTNKALAEAIRTATPEQLTQLKEGKDIKSLLSGVFQDKITASKSDQTLLDILKNGAAFKNMGNFTENLKSLLSELKNAPLLTQKVESIEGFFKNITSMNTATLKSQLSNSGVFMESKIAAAVQILPTLKETLTSLQNLLSKSPLPEAKTLSSTIGSLIESSALTHPPQDIKGAAVIADTLKHITDSLKNIVAKSDVLYSKEITQFSQKIDQLASAPQAAVAEIKTTLSQLYGALLSSKADGVNPLLDSIELLLKNINNTTQDPIVPLKELSNQLQEAISSGDVMVSHETSVLIAKLDEFTNPKSLLLDHALQESMSDDLKSGLMNLSESLQESSDPSAKVLLEHVDKLLTQIDYQQLVSHLNHSNSIYFPFAWDQLDEGSMTFKKNNNKKFYCEINLRLKEYGELDLMMGLYEGNQIEIQAHTQLPQLKELIQENIAQLRTLLINAGLTPRSIRVYETKESPQSISDSYGSQDFGSDLGFEVKV